MPETMYAGGPLTPGTPFVPAVRWLWRQFAFRRELDRATAKMRRAGSLAEQAAAIRELGAVLDRYEVPMESRGLLGMLSWGQRAPA